MSTNEFGRCCFALVADASSLLTSLYVLEGIQAFYVTTSKNYIHP
jgi:hypothetical protein